MEVSLADLSEPLRVLWLLAPGEAPPAEEWPALWRGLLTYRANHQVVLHISNILSPDAAERIAAADLVIATGGVHRDTLAWLGRPGLPVVQLIGSWWPFVPGESHWPSVDPANTLALATHQLQRAAVGVSGCGEMAQRWAPVANAWWPEDAGAPPRANSMSVADRCVALAHRARPVNSTPQPPTSPPLDPDRAALATEHLSAGLDAADSGEVKPAEVLFFRADALAPGWHLPMAELARLAARQGAWHEAHDYAEEALRRCSNSHLATVASVAAAQHLRGHDAAEALAETALLEQPTNIGVYHWLAAFRQAKGMAKSAQELWRLALFANPHDPQALLALATSVAKRGRHHEAEALLARCARLLPEEPAVARLEAMLDKASARAAAAKAPRSSLQS